MCPHLTPCPAVIGVRKVIRIRLQVADNYSREIVTVDPSQIGPWLLANVDKHSNSIECNATIRTWEEPADK